MKKLKLNKEVITSLESNQIKGGIGGGNMAALEDCIMTAKTCPGLKTCDLVASCYICPTDVTCQTKCLTCPGCM